MAISMYYVSPLSGDDSTGDGSIGTPWKSVQHALDTITRNSTDGDQINVQSGAADVLAATLSLATFGTPTNAAPLIIRGYTSAAGDGGVGEIDGGSNTIANNLPKVSFIDMRLVGNGDSDVVSLSTDAALIRCQVDTYIWSNKVAVVTRAGCAVLGCHIKHGVRGVSVAGTSRVVGNYIYQPGYGIFDQNTAGSVYAGNVIVLAQQYQWGVFLAANTAGAIIAHNTIINTYPGSAAGIELYATAPRQLTVLNNLIAGFSGAGGTGIRVPYAAHMIAGNAVYNCTTPYLIAAMLEFDNETLGSDPFVDAAGSDFRLKTDSDAIEAAWPGAFPGLAEVENLADVGAYQRGAGSGGGGAAFYRRVARILGG